MRTELVKDSSDSIPAPISAAGPLAVAQYRAFLGHPRWRPQTRALYGQRIRRFLRWAEQRGLALDAVDMRTLHTYRDEIAAARSSQVACVHLTPVRGFFRSLVSAGVLSRDFFEERMDRLATSDSRGHARPAGSPGPTTQAAVGALPEGEGTAEPGKPTAAASAPADGEAG
jgi:hypothetical protein